MRRRRSTSCSSGTLTLKGRIVLSSAAAAKCAGQKLRAPAAAEMARTSRRVDDVAHMAVSLVGSAMSLVRMRSIALTVNHGRVIMWLVFGYQRVTRGSEEPPQR